jgi:hypothetical protein
MQDLDPATRTKNGGLRWHLLWVGAALVFAWMNLSEFATTHAPHSLVLATSWMCWAFSWYTQPFRVRWSANAFAAVERLPRHPRVNTKLWNAVTIAGMILLLMGLGLKFATAT